MQDKPYVMLAYVLIGFVLAALPALQGSRSAGLSQREVALRRGNDRGLWSLASAVWLLLILLLTLYTRVVTPSTALGIAAISLLLAYRGGRIAFNTLLPGFFALCVAMLLPWWRRPDEAGINISLSELLASGLCVLIVVQTLMYARSDTLHRGMAVFLMGYAVPAAVFSFSAGILQADSSLLTLWHHWGAYIGPAELMLAGAKLFHDIPLQYGFGPTSLLAASCRNDCWSAMYVITGITTLLWTLAIAAMALLVSSPRAIARVIVLALCLTACFFWTAYPPATASPLVTPSVAGLRFLPATLLALYLCLTSNIERSRGRLVVGHLLWAVGALWSPESAFYVTLVWWPYYLFVRRASGSFGVRLGAAIRNALVLAIIAVALATLFYSALRLIYGEGPTLYGYLAYAINPPGPLPIDPHGNVWYFVVAIAIAAATLALSWKAVGDTMSFRRGLVLLLLAYGSFTYFLGRSHENNILNILPLLLLALLYVVQAAKQVNLAHMAAILGASLLAWTPLFGWNDWQSNLGKGRLFDFGPSALLPAVTFSNPQTQDKLRARLAGATVGDPADAGRAIQTIKAESGDAITVLDSAMNMNGVSPPSAWSAIHGPANFGFIPSERRREFLAALAKTLRRSGWLVMDKRYPEREQWLADYDSAYRRDKALDFGSYIAIHYVPKTAP
ncbi:hypothetical protein [Achromobacter sp. UMC46]|uniref:hypothetical protein n=1 Tax=Achromobacter sp. UMC46 TaxID=1862319 RepID=UPI00160038CB|nr:hypothetical protein [Achromobacter sp. UMC46]MBB1598190.1 hypothetical protein [Achromobacter sp. UMC46]